MEQVATRAQDLSPSSKFDLEDDALVLSRPCISLPLFTQQPIPWSYAEKMKEPYRSLMLCIKQL